MATFGDLLVEAKAFLGDLGAMIIGGDDTAVNPEAVVAAAAAREPSPPEETEADSAAPVKTEEKAAAVVHRLFPDPSAGKGASLVRKYEEIGQGKALYPDVTLPMRSQFVIQHATVESMTYYFRTLEATTQISGAQETLTVLRISDPSENVALAPASLARYFAALGRMRPLPDRNVRVIQISIHDMTDDFMGDPWHPETIDEYARAVLALASSMESVDMFLLEGRSVHVLGQSFPEEKIQSVVLVNPEVRQGSDLHTNLCAHSQRLTLVEEGRRVPTLENVKRHPLNREVAPEVVAEILLGRDDGFELL